jgi:murein DD-endopeptidase MepM/ murein hydrolase activator NlpD
VAPAAPEGQPKPRGGSASVATPEQPRERREEGLGHIVRNGDSLWTIARRYGVTLDALARANRIEPREHLRAGQRLTIPGEPAPGNQEPPSLAAIVLTRPPAARAPAFAWPISAPVDSAFGPRSGGWHGGVDIRAEQGDPIRAAAPGMVITSGWEEAYGRVIKIWHAFDFMTVYAHNHENLVRVGEWVERGTVIGTVGRSGRATAPHLHFEIRLEGRKYDPLFWLPPAGTVDVATSGSRAAASVP